MHVSVESHLTGGLGYAGYEVKAYGKRPQNQRSSAESVGTQEIYENAGKIIKSVIYI